MNNQKVAEEDFIGLPLKTRLCGHHGKFIDVIIDPVEKRIWYELNINYDIVYTGPDLAEAIEYYNAAVSTMRGII